MASCASKVHRASARGKPVLISVFACSLGFHINAALLQKSPILKKGNARYFTCSLRVVAENMVTNGQTDIQTDQVLYACVPRVNKK